MSRLVRFVGVCAVVVVVPGASAQAPASLAGKWTLIPEASGADSGRGRGAPATAGSGWGQEITITQDAARLTIERAQFSRYDMQPPMRFVYALDGSESHNVINMGRGPQEQVSRASWKGSSLVISTRHVLAILPTAAPQSSEVTQVFSIDASGALVIETTRGSQENTAASTTKERYRKG